MAADFTIKKGDTAYPLNATLIPPLGQTLNLTGASVVFKMWAQSQSPTLKVNAAATIVDPLACTVRYTFQPADVDTAEGYLAQWVVTLAGGAVATFPNSKALTVRVIG
jgi:hypothetical protein